MHHPNAEAILFCTVLYEILQPGFGLCERHTVQIDLRLHAVSTATEFAHGASTDMLSTEAQGSA